MDDYVGGLAESHSIFVSCNASIGTSVSVFHGVQLQRTVRQDTPRAALGAGVETTTVMLPCHSGLVDVGVHRRIR